MKTQFRIREESVPKTEKKLAGSTANTGSCSGGSMLFQQKIVVVFLAQTGPFPQK